MRKYTERHKQLLKEINEKSEYLSGIVNERIADSDAPIPIDYMLESRFLEVKKQAIKIESEINYIEEDVKENGDSADSVSKLERLEKRLLMIKGSTNELLNMSQIFIKLGIAGREFEIVG